MPVFGYKNRVGVDREHGFLRRFVVTHAAAYDGGQLGVVLDRNNTASEVWADTAYGSAVNPTAGASPSRMPATASRNIKTCFS